jgi:DNA-binding CsgD family transcriptional regulator
MSQLRQWSLVVVVAEPLEPPRCELTATGWLASWSSLGCGGAGAVEFLTKPFDDDMLLRAIAGAIERSRTALGRQAEVQTLRDRYAGLSHRECEVMALVVAGLLNKQIAGELGISEITVKAHRGRVMRKMQADSLAGLVKMAAGLQLPAPLKLGSRIQAHRQTPTSE